MQITTSRIVRSKWSSEKAFILATAAAAIGLGNIWRFPYIAGENGGGAFIFAYIIAVLVIGLPLMLVEISAGRVEHGGVVKTFRAINKHAAWIGWGVVVLTFVIMSYYLVITGWTLGYAVDSIDGNIRSFSEFTQTTEPILYFGLVAIITALVILRGVRLIEIVSRLLVPVLLGIILLLTVYSLTLPGARDALLFLFTPDFSALTSPSIWALAFGQAFYSLAIGQGYLMTYGSFLPPKVDIPRATTTVAVVETFVALVAGVMIFPIVFTFGLNPGQGTELVFTTMPLAFQNIAIGPILATIFFCLLFLAAISSCIAGMEVIKTAIEEELRLTKRWATAAVFFALFPLGILSALSFTPLEFEIFGRPFLEVMDLITANQVVIISGLLGGAVIGWSIPRQEFVNLFANRYRAFASQVVITARYLWIGVLGVLILSLIS